MGMTDGHTAANLNSGFSTAQIAPDGEGGLGQ